MASWISEGVVVGDPMARRRVWTSVGVTKNWGVFIAASRRMAVRVELATRTARRAMDSKYIGAPGVPSNESRTHDWNTAGAD